MTAREVVGAVERPVGSGMACVGARVVATLYTGADAGIAYGTANDVVVGSVAVLTSNAGTWSILLEPNAGITPVGTVWQVEITHPDGDILVDEFIDVPDTAGPHDFTDLLAEQPGALPSQALAAHAALTTAHGIYARAVDVRTYSADPTGSAAADSAIASAISAAGVAGLPVLFAGGSYKIAGTVDIPDGVDVVFQDAELVATTAVTVALQLTGSNKTVIGGLRIRRESIGWIGASPSDSTSVGLRLKNCYGCKVDVARIGGFATGLDLHGQGSDGSSYNVVTLGSLVDNKIGLSFTAEGSGWSNDNSIIGGQIRNSSSSHNGSSGVVSGTRFVLIQGNGNRLFGVALEGATRTERSALVSKPYNMFWGCRFESAAPIEFTSPDGYFNVVGYGYGVHGHNDHRDTIQADDLEIIDGTGTNIVLGPYGINAMSNATRGGRAAFSGRATASGTELEFEGRNVDGSTTFSVQGDGTLTASLIKLARPTTLPVPSVSHVGEIRIRSFGGVEDKVCACVLSADGSTYKWINLVNGATVT